eukprot:CAMPEP_0202980656 /NCGR_PEP_ID=MMETSP1396-20130829/86536_1 /ASSEMBLY_ACC=CAM_ASM_000872 /TAXON_ID= /ORGANISM="Pseudokeronopsis sp., Strain Brazil" /LENGTH=52 /DNA_ID=CAMNT_0049720763 /DNA_START=486 /DNA_END=644 /DNA_ORIENTATION=+
MTCLAFCGAMFFLLLRKPRKHMILKPIEVQDDQSQDLVAEEDALDGLEDMSR